MSEVGQQVPQSPQQIRSVLDDGWSLGLWLLGVAHLHEVDRAWPAPLSEARIDLGFWPWSVPGRITVLDHRTNPYRLQLRVTSRWLPSRLVEVRLRPAEQGTVLILDDRPESSLPVPGPLRSSAGRRCATEALSRLVALLNRDQPHSCSA